LVRVIERLFEKTEKLIVRRLGFRYINALRTDVHGIKSILDLDFIVTAAGERLPGNVNVNFTKALSDDTQCTVRIATADFIQGSIPPTTTVVIDVDVFTKESFRTKDVANVKQWIEQAHTQEKEHFFRLLTNETIDALEEK